MESALADGDDPNAELCVDPILRADVANALGKVTDNSCKGIVKAILFNLNRPGWAVNCVDFTEFGFAGFYQKTDWDTPLDKGTMAKWNDIIHGISGFVGIVRKCVASTLGCRIAPRLDRPASEAADKPEARLAVQAVEPANSKAVQDMCRLSGTSIEPSPHMKF
ncbi:unnamed protein product [Heligmosomoides polygyrus]|uniref:Bacteriophage protein n=1 Tax=Heligmosomoides polygyrus TaxID=6339 RepID=A0A3P7YIY7_HELPZ|nr:unnamed protein product [Heligmosomoides polygyrus]